MVFIHVIVHETLRLYIWTKLFSILRPHYNLFVGVIERDSSDRPLYGFLDCVFCERGYSVGGDVASGGTGACNRELPRVKLVDMSGIELLLFIKEKKTLKKMNKK